MKKFTFLIAGLLFSTLSFSQETYLENDTLYLENGGVLVDGGNIKFGKGTKDNGYFRYVEVNSGSMMRAYNTNGTNWGVQDANSMSSQYNDLEGKIIRFVERGNRRTGKKWYAIIGVGEVRRYQVDIKNAIESGEIIVDGSSLAPKDNTQIATVKTSKADELLKLKGLKEQGLITEQEYEDLKKEIINN